MIQFTGKSATGLTGVTRAKYNSTARAHDNGTSTYYFKEDWKDLGAAETSNVRPVKNWEDKVLIGNGQYVAMYSGDGSDFDASKLHLPSGYSVVDFGFVPTGSSSKILVLANKDEVGTIFVWDGSDTTWTTTIDMENLTRADGTFIATDIGIYECNGVTTSLFWRPPDANGSIIGNQVTFYDIKEKGNYLIASVSSGSTIRRFKSAVWIINKNTRDSYLVTPPSGGGYGEAVYSIFSSGENFLLFGSSYANGAVFILSSSPSATNSLYWTLFKPANARNIKIKQVRLNVNVDPTSYGSGSTNVLDFDVTLRCYDFTKQLFQYTQLKSGQTATAANTLVVVDTLGVPSVGDRIEVIQKSASNQKLLAGSPRNITAVTAGTGIYTLTLDSDLPEAPDATTYNGSLMTTITPLKLVGKKSINTSIDLDDLTFQLADQPKGKKFLFEIDIKCTNTNIAPELNSLEIEYDVL